jgi:hypothetical protein
MKRPGNLRWRQRFSWEYDGVTPLAIGSIAIDRAIVISSGEATKVQGLFELMHLVSFSASYIASPMPNSNAIRLQLISYHLLSLFLTLAPPCALDFLLDLTLRHVSCCFNPLRPVSGGYFVGSYLDRLQSCATAALGPVMGKRPSSVKYVGPSSPTFTTCSGQWDWACSISDAEISKGVFDRTRSRSVRNRLQNAHTLARQCNHRSSQSNSTAPFYSCRATACAAQCRRSSPGFHDISLRPHRPRSQSRCYFTRSEASAEE